MTKKTGNCWYQLVQQAFSLEALAELVDPTGKRTLAISDRHWRDACPQLALLSLRNGSLRLSFSRQELLESRAGRSQPIVICYLH